MNTTVIVNEKFVKASTLKLWVMITYHIFRTAPLNWLRGMDAISLVLDYQILRE